MFNSLLDSNDLSIVLNLPPRRVKRLARKGEIPHVVLPGNEIRFEPEEIADWVNQLPHVPAAGVNLTDIL